MIKTNKAFPVTMLNANPEYVIDQNVNTISYLCNQRTRKK